MKRGGSEVSGLKAYTIVRFNYRARAKNEHDILARVGIEIGVENTFWVI